MGRRWVTVELLQSTVEKFTQPRLAKVVRGEDAGGITIQKERVGVADLPEGMTSEDAQRTWTAEEFHTVLAAHPLLWHLVRRLDLTEDLRPGT